MYSKTNLTLATSLIMTMFLSGCANTAADYEPIVDGPKDALFYDDLADCKNLLSSVNILMTIPSLKPFLVQVSGLLSVRLAVIPVILLAVRWLVARSVPVAVPGIPGMSVKISCLSVWPAVATGLWAKPFQPAPLQGSPGGIICVTIGGSCLLFWGWHSVNG